MDRHEHTPVAKDHTGVRNTESPFRWTVLFHSLRLCTCRHGDSHVRLLSQLGLPLRAQRLSPRIFDSHALVVSSAPVLRLRHEGGLQHRSNYWPCTMSHQINKTHNQKPMQSSKRARGVTRRRSQGHWIRSCNRYAVRGCQRLPEYHQGWRRPHYP